MDELSRQIEEAALAAAINPKTGQRFTLDEIIDRNASPALPTQGGDRPTWSERGRSLTSPRACFIQSAWCHWADGWTLYLVNGCVIQEVPGHKWAHHNVCTYAHLLPGWYIFDKEGKVVLHQAARSAFDPHPYECEWPDPDGLELLWQKYLLCLELGYLKLDPSSPWHVDGYAPCPNCNPDPPIPRIHSGLLPRVCVPLNTPWRSRAGGTDAPTMAEIHTLWRYHGKRGIVTRSFSMAADPQWARACGYSDAHLWWVELALPDSSHGSMHMWDDGDPAWESQERGRWVAPSRLACVRSTKFTFDKLMHVIKRRPNEVRAGLLVVWLLGLLGYLICGIGG